MNRQQLRDTIWNAFSEFEAQFGGFDAAVTALAEYNLSPFLLKAEYNTWLQSLPKEEL